MKIRLYYSGVLASNLQVVMDERADHYLRSVMRVGVGCEVYLFNEKYGEWLSTIASISKKSIAAQVVNLTQQPHVVGKVLGVMLPLIKKDTLSTMVRQSVEMGARKITLFTSQHSLHYDLNIQRLLSIATEAIEQSNSIEKVVINEPQLLLNALKELEGFVVWGNEKMCCADEVLSYSFPCQKYKTMQSEFGRCNALIGPEGGFSSAEVEALKENARCLPASLGKNILKCDTAAVALLQLCKNLDLY